MLPLGPPVLLWLLWLLGLSFRAATILLRILLPLLVVAALTAAVVVLAITVLS